MRYSIILSNYSLSNIRVSRNFIVSFFLFQTKGTTNTIDDANQYKEVIKAMKTMEMSQQEQNDLFAIVASVLHMGNVGFTEEDGVATILKPASVDAIATVTIFKMVYLEKRKPLKPIKIYIFNRFFYGIVDTCGIIFQLEQFIRQYQ